jgi:integrase
LGEAAALRRRRCELSRSRLAVAESVSEVDGRLVFGDTKSPRLRMVTLPPSVCADLAAHLRDNVAPGPDAFVFTAPAGGPLRYGNFMRRVWRPAAERAGLGDVTPHLLRHTSATLLVDAGASIKDVQAHLGHADGAVTLNIYSAVLRDRADDLAERMERIRRDAQGNASGTYVARDGGEEGEPPAAIPR